MNEFMVVLKCPLNDDIRRFFKNREVEILFYDEMLNDLFICRTTASLEEVKEWQYVYDVKPPRMGNV